MLVPVFAVQMTNVAVALGREILESQQGEMDFLLTQQRDTKRDSRLVRERENLRASCSFIHLLFFCLKAFLYDLEKVILYGSLVS